MAYNQMGYGSSGLDLVSQLRNNATGSYAASSYQQQTPVQQQTSFTQQGMQQQQSSIPQQQGSQQFYGSDMGSADQFGKYGSGGYTLNYDNSNVKDIFQPQSQLNQSSRTQTNQITPMSTSGNDQSQQLAQQQLQQLQLLQMAQMQAAKQQVQLQAQLQNAQMQNMQMQSSSWQPSKAFVPQKSQPSSQMNYQQNPMTLDDVLESGLNKKQKKDLHSALVLHDWDFSDTLNQIMNSQDHIKIAKRAGKNKFKDALQRHLHVKVEPQTEGLQVWKKLSLNDKRDLKNLFLEKRFKESLEEKLSADQAAKLVLCGREWMRTRLFETFGEEVEFFVQPKRPREGEDGAEPVEAETEKKEPPKQSRTGRTIFLSLTNEQRTTLKMNLERKPFKDAIDDMKISPSDKELLIGTTRYDGLKALFKQIVGVEPRPYTGGNKSSEKGASAPASTVKLYGAATFSELTEEQKVFLRDELKVAGFKITLEQLKISPARIESLLKDGREVLKTRLKEHFKLDDLEFFKKPNREEEAKMRFEALSEDLKHQVHGALLKFPFNEALSSIEDGTDIPTRNAFKTFGRDGMVELLKEHFKTDIELEGEDELREKLFTEFKGVATPEVLKELRSLLQKLDFASAVKSEGLELDLDMKTTLLGAGKKKVMDLLQEHFEGEMILCVSDMATLVFARMSVSERKSLRDLLSTKMWCDAEPLIKAKTPVQRKYLTAVGAAGLKTIMEQHYGEEIFFPGLPGFKATKWKAAAGPPSKMQRRH